jgi:hypothetical protein
MEIFCCPFLCCDFRGWACERTGGLREEEGIIGGRREAKQGCKSEVRKGKDRRSSAGEGDWRMDGSVYFAPAPISRWCRAT